MAGGGSRLIDCKKDTLVPLDEVTGAALAGATAAVTTGVIACGATSAGVETTGVGVATEAAGETDEACET